MKPYLYRRNLPHWYPPNVSIFITWRLHGSLPTSFEQDIERGALSTDREKFRRSEALLDKATEGPLWLVNRDPAKELCEIIEAGEFALNLYKLHAYVVMANHVHVLVSSNAEVWQITKHLKGTSARKCNLILGRTGEKFWQTESFDHWCRDQEQFYRIRNYIAHNPVKAGFVDSPEKWPWSSAARMREIRQNA